MDPRFENSSTSLSRHFLEQPIRKPPPSSLQQPGGTAVDGTFQIDVGSAPNVTPWRNAASSS
eukprot:5868463-Prymnesium_polylepis.2